MLPRKHQTFTRGRTPVAAQNTIIVKSQNPQPERIEVAAAVPVNAEDSSTDWKTSVGMARPSKFSIKVPQQKSFLPKND